MKVPYLDLRVREKDRQQKLIRRLERVLRHGRIIEGPEVSELETAIAERVGVRYAVGTASGSSALYLALKSIGIGKGDEVITTPFTWVITAHAIAETGATPVFSDIGEDLNLDPDLIESKITERTKAIVPMHVGGLLCDMERLCRIGKRHKLHIVEDAAQAIASSRSGKHAGCFSIVSAFSMNPMKVLHGYGEAGAVTTNSKQVFEKLKRYRHAGTQRDPSGRTANSCRFTSLNHKIDTLQAAFILENLSRLDEVISKRDEIAELYDSTLPEEILLPMTSTNEVHGRYLYLIRTKNRDALQLFLSENGVESKIVYSPLLSDLRPYKQKEALKLPKSRSAVKDTLSIPMHENMTARQAKHVSNLIVYFLTKRKR